MAHVTFILGGARSGKSRHAEQLITAQPAPWVYIATAEARDGEMAERIAHHQARRGAGWTTVESPLDLAGAIAEHGAPGKAILIDCLTLWLSNLIEAGRDCGREAVVLVRALADTSCRAVIVSNEVGLGIVPDNAAARRFRDEAGRLHQSVAAAADEVLFMVAGLPLQVKG